jgi:hypothetical protein
MRAHLARRELGAAAPAARHPRPRWASTLNLQGPPSSLHVAGARRSLRALVKCARIWRPVRSARLSVRLGAASPAAQQSPPLRVTLDLRVFSSSVQAIHPGRDGRSVRAFRKVRAHLLPGEPGGEAPAAEHPRPSRALDEIECRVLLKLPHTHPTPTPATSPRHTRTAERQRCAVALPRALLVV